MSLEPYNLDLPTPIYIRKISPSHWNPDDCNNQQERARLAASRIFKDPISSIWLVNSNLDFYGMLASTSPSLKDKPQHVDFIWITEEEFMEVSVKLELFPEGNCLHSKHLHFHVHMSESESIQLCEKLIAKDRKRHRCKKEQVIQIFNYLNNLGCKAILSNSERCKCQN